MAGATVDLVRAVYEDFAAKDIPAVLKAFAPDIEWTVAEPFPYAGTYVGGEAVVENVFVPIPNDWDGFRHELHHFIDCGPTVVAVGTYRGTWKRTGRDMEAPFVHLFDVEDGLITRFRQYVDGPGTVQATDGHMHGSA